MLYIVFESVIRRRKIYLRFYWVSTMMSDADVSLSIDWDIRIGDKLGMMLAQEGSHSCSVRQTVYRC